MMMLLATALAAALLQEPAPADLSWMSGYWLDCSNGREASETWTDPRAGTMIGAAAILSSGRLTFEYARIGPVGGTVSYMAQPGGASPTAFALIDSTRGRAVFENRENDFPQRVIYAREGDVLTARIEGHMNDREQSMDWHFDKADLNTRCPN